MSDSQPFMNVVVISYNGEKTLRRTLDSLLAQDYPHSKFKIIVVNDGSTDNTGKIIDEYADVKHVKQVKNGGISSARNAGLRAVTHGVYVACDDDCVLSPDWLSQLAQGYNLDKPAGVGGYLAELTPLDGILKQYIGILGGGFPPIAQKDKIQHTFKRRLYTYLTARLRHFDIKQDDHVEVTELYGANGSFPVDVLKAVNGWHEDMSGIEDRDLSLRIRKQFPDRHFYAIKNAQMMHDPSLSLKQFLLRPYKRGPVTLHFHRKNDITPPVFPFPILFLLAICATILVNYLFLPLVLCILPQLLYYWWPFHAVKRQEPLYFAFPYLQLAEESMVTFGLLRGYILHAKNTTHAHH